MSNNDVQTPNLKDLQNHENESIKRTANEIAEIKGTDSEKQKVQLEGILTTEFANTLTLDQQTANTLLTEANNAKNAKGNNYTELNDLIAFLELIVKPHQVNGTLDITEGENQNSVITKFDDYFNVSDGSLKDISLLPPESQNTINNIQKILKNPTTKNIQQLQNFLYNNLSDNEKDDFLKKNGKKVNDNITWDGKIGKCEKNASGEFTGSTAKALDDFLKNTADYVDKYTAHKEITNQGNQQQQKKIENVKATINTLNNTNTLTIQDIEQATNDYNTLSNGEKAQIDKNIKQKLDEAEQTLNTLKDKINGITVNINSIITSSISLEQKTYELTKLLKEKITPEEAQILLNSINGNQNGTITIRNLNIDNNKEIFKQALTNITKDNIPSQETEAQKQEKTQAQIEQNNNASKSFDEVSTELQKIGNAKINAILTQIAPLNEKLKQGHSISYLETEKTRLENAIKNFGGEDTSFKENGKIESGLDKGVKKRFRKEIRDLEKQLMDVHKELKDKKEIKDKIYKKEGEEKESGMITEIKNIISAENNKDYYIGAIDSYINNLDNMGQDVEDKQKSANETTQGENTPEQTNQTQTPEQAQKGKSKEGINTKTRTLSELFTKFFEAFAGGGTFIEKMNKFWKDLIGKESTTKSDDLKINLEDLANNSIIENNDDVKMALEAINNETKAFNGRKEIVDTIKSKDQSKIANLQRKLRTFPVGEGEGEGKQESQIKITGTIDKTTANALKTYATEQANEKEQNNGTEMPYAFCEGYTEIDTKIPNAEVYKEDGKNPINYIVIQKDESGNISSITKGQLLNEESVNENPTTIPTFDTKSAKVYKLGTEGNNNTSIVENNYTVPPAT